MSYAKTLQNNLSSSVNNRESFHTPAKIAHNQSASLFTSGNSLSRTAATTDIKNALSPTAFSPQQTTTSFLSTRQPKLDEVHQRYEREAQNVQRKYETHYEESLALGSSVVELQGLLDLENRKTQDLGARINELYRALEQEKDARLDGDRENRDLREKARRNNITLADYEQKLSNVQQNAVSVGFENDSWKMELRKLNEKCNEKLKESEKKHAAEVKLLGEELDELRSLVKDREIDNETKIRTITRELEAKIRSLENQGREKDRIIMESESELKSMKEFNMKVKMEFEEEVRKRMAAAKDEEKKKQEAVIKSLEARVSELETEVDLLRNNMEDVGKDVRNKEERVRDVKMRYEEQVRALKREVNDLKDKMSVDVSEIERLQGELRGKDPIIARLQQEIQNINTEMANHKGTYVQEINRLAVRNDNDVRRFQEFERQLKGRIVELERLLKGSESEVGKLKTALEKLRQNVAGSIERTIAQTFVDYGAVAAGNQGR